MKTIIRHIAFPLVIVIIFSSFKPTKRNSIANGSGIADGISFSMYAVEQNKGVVTGYIHYGDNDYIVNWGKWFGTSAILGTTDGHAFYVSDNGKPGSPDWISDPISAINKEWLSTSDFFGVHFVAIGNIQVKE